MALTLDGTTGISATGNIYGNNIIVTNSLTAGSFSPALLSSTGNVTGGNLLTGGLISAAGNITGAYILGNGSQLTGVDATQIVNGTSNAKVVSSGGNIAVGIGGTSNVTVFATTGAYVTGLVSATGTITGTSHLGAVVSVTGNVTGGNILTGGVVSATGNINANFFIGNGSQLSGLSASKIFNGTSEANIGTSGGNANITIGGTSNVFVVATTGIYTTGLSSVSGNITGANFLTGGLISATGNIAGGNLSGTNIVGTLTTAAQTNITSVGTLSSLAVTANVTGGNLLTGGLISSTGTITGSSHLGSVVSVTANVTGGNILTGGLISAAGALITGGDHSLTGNIVDTGTLWINTTSNGNINLNPNGSGQTNIPVGILSVTANVIGGNILTAGLMSSTGNAVHSNVIINGTAALGSGVLIVSGNIQTSTSNATANIGNASNYFNRLFAQATTALYADLAEVYRADAQYPPGTVLVFGGTQEVTMSMVSHDNKIAGVVSTHPAHVMNSGLVSEFTVEVGLIGRVPCRVIGPIAAGDRVVSSNRAGVAERLDMTQYQPGVIIGKALENYSSTDVGTIEVVVGRL